MKILFTGGGTGGHVLPIIAIVRELRRIHPKEDLRFYYLGPKDEFGNILLSQEGIKVRTVLSGKMRRYIDFKSVLQNVVDIFFKIPIGVFQSFWYIFFWNVDLIFSKGGYGSISSVFSSWILQVPIFLHESDIAPGLSNKILSKFALEVFISFPGTEYFSPKKMILVGNPIRKEILEGSKDQSLIVGGKPVILILGGSQGAQRINDQILNILQDMLSSFEIIHQCGENNFNQVKAEAKAITNKELIRYYHPYPFFKEDELKQVFQMADFVISRAGSGAIFEIAALGKPSILVPLLDSAQNHQYKNAYAYAENGASIVLEEENFSSHFVLEKLRNLFADPEKLKQMSIKAKEFSKPESAKIIASYLISYLTS